MGRSFALSEAVRFAAKLVFVTLPPPGLADQLFGFCELVQRAKVAYTLAMNIHGNGTMLDKYGV